MKNYENKLIEIFCHVDDFNKVFINDQGDILDFILTPGNVDDRQPLTGSNLLVRIYGKLFGDKGYLSQTLFEKLTYQSLFAHAIH